jgi:hypothetical protein
MKLFTHLISLIFFLSISVYCQDKILVISPDNDLFKTTFSGINNELEGDYEVNWINSKEKDKILKALSSSQSKAIVAMDIDAINIVKEFQKKDAKNAKTPVFVSNTLQVEQSSKGLKNASGVKFEVPAFTIFSNLKVLSKSEVNKVLVFHRKIFNEVMAESKQMLAKEKIELIMECLDCEESKELTEGKAVKLLTKRFAEITKKNKPDVIWLLADNLLLTSQTLGKFWIPKVVKKNYPIVVPLENLASPEFNLGMIALIPDYQEIGNQIANQIREVLEEDGSTEDLGFENLISVHVILNLKKANSIDWKINEENLNRAKKIYR